MANEEMAKPTGEQTAALEETMAALKAAASKAGDITLTISRLRSRLNDARNMLSSVKTVIGPGAYRYNSRDTWHSDIDVAIAEIDKVLK